MKNLKLIVLTVLGITSLQSCSKDDNGPVNEEEVITTITTTLTNGSNEIILRSRDLDGDGPNAPIITVSGKLMANTNYSGAVTFLNETVTPADDITIEVKEEGVEHQLFFQIPDALGTIIYKDEDANGKPIGLAYTLTTRGAATGNYLSITLKHLPNKSAMGVSGGDITNAGGATDVFVTFPIDVE